MTADSYLLASPPGPHTNGQMSKGVAPIWGTDAPYVPYSALWTWAALATLVFALHHNILQGWWGWDDPQILKQAMRHAPWEYFFVPKVWHELTAAFLTPWGTLSFDMDLALFGLRPGAFYLHHLLALWLVACATFTLLRMWVNTFYSTLGAALFVVGAPLVPVSQQLSARHYVEGFLFAVLSLYLYVRFLREGRSIFSWAGGLSYALAVSAKEVYVPLVLVLPFLLEQTWRRRLRAALPFFFVLAGYVLWRWLMLGVLVGGYGDVIDWKGLVIFWINAGQYMLGPGRFAMVSSFLAIVLIAGVVRRGWRILPLIFVVLLMIAGPLVPLRGVDQERLRYILVPWWVFSMTIPLTCSCFTRSANRNFILAVLLFGWFFGTVFLQRQITAGSLRPIIQEMEAEGKFIWNEDKGKVLFASTNLATHFHFATGLLWLKRTGSSPPSGPQVVVDEIELERLDLSQTQVWRYARSCGCMRDISVSVPDMLAQWRIKQQVRPLSLTFEYTGNLVSWKFGPYQHGTYSIVDDTRFGRLPLANPGYRRVALPNAPFAFHLRYDSPEGWVTYSPQLEVNPQLSRKLVWQR